MAEANKAPESHPGGIWKFKTLDQKLGKNDNTGNMFLKLKVEALALKKAYKPSSQPVKVGWHGYVDMYMTPKTIEKTKAFLLAAGYSGKGILRLDPDHSEFESLAGFEFDGTNNPEISKSENEKYKGKLLDKLSALPVRGASDKWAKNVKGVDAVVAAQFDALWNSAPSPAGYQSPSNAQIKALPPVAKAAVTDEGPAPDWSGGIPEDSSW